MFFIERAVIAWIVWLICADKNRWREILPVCVLASFLAALTDLLMKEYKLWEYYSELGSLCTIFLDEFEVYPVVTYLFIQWLPKNRTFASMFWYWFKWTGLAIAIEWIHVHAGYMMYFQWWNMGCSYIADYILFWIFYKFHQALHLEKLSLHPK